MDPLDDNGLPPQAPDQSGTDVTASTTTTVGGDGSDVTTPVTTTTQEPSPAGPPPADATPAPSTIPLFGSGPEATGGSETYPGSPVPGDGSTPPTPTDTAPATGGYQAEPTQAQVVAYLQAHPDELDDVLAELDESTGAQLDEAQQEFIGKYLRGNPDFAAKVVAEFAPAAATPVTPDPVVTAPETTPTNEDPKPTTPEATTPPADEQPTSNLPAVIPPAPAAPAPKQPKPFPVPAYYGVNDECQVNLGAVKVSGTVTGVYYDGDGLTYQVAVHVADGVPMLGTSARALKMDVPADLVGDPA